MSSFSTAAPQTCSRSLVLQVLHWPPFSCQKLVRFSLSMPSSVAGGSESMRWTDTGAILYWWQMGDWGLVTKLRGRATGWRSSERPSPPPPPPPPSPYHRPVVSSLALSLPSATSTKWCVSKLSLFVRGFLATLNGTYIVCFSETLCNVHTVDSDMRPLRESEVSARSSRIGGAYFWARPFACLAGSASWTRSLDTKRSPSASTPRPVPPEREMGTSVWHLCHANPDLGVGTLCVWGPRPLWL